MGGYGSRHRPSFLLWSSQTPLVAELEASASCSAPKHDHSYSTVNLGGLRTYGLRPTVPQILSLRSSWLRLFFSFSFCGGRPLLSASAARSKDFACRTHTSANISAPFPLACLNSPRLVWQVDEATRTSTQPRLQPPRHPQCSSRLYRPVGRAPAAWGLVANSHFLTFYPHPP
ncbi:hypothetical protein BC826DRAFT_1025066 [Russula brevipes]|nr:hypothetical protein BC826DRAFT_1025066 [Russula brevipes]